MTESNTSPVAVYFAKKLHESGKTQREVARECGFENPNVITMFKQGDTKFPLNRIGPLAEAVGADPAHMLRLAMSEYMPETWEAVESVFQSTPLTDGELDLIRENRRLTDGEEDAIKVILNRRKLIAVLIE